MCSLGAILFEKERSNTRNVKMLAVFLMVLFTADVIKPATTLVCHCDECESNLTCTTTEDGACWVGKDKLYPYSISRDCFNWLENVIDCDPDADLRDEYDYRCCYTDMCNDNKLVNVTNAPAKTKATPQKASERSTQSSSTPNHRLQLTVFFCVCGAGVIVLLSVLLHRRFCVCENPPRDGPQAPQSIEHGIVTDPFSSTASAMTCMTQRTIAQEVSIYNVIGGGRFGKVHKGIWRGDVVAVKIFKTTEQEAWEREIEAYSKYYLHHRNILGFIGSDCKDDLMQIQLLIVFDYHENGSLYDYLQSATLSVAELLSMVISIVDGLCYLHTAIIGQQGKPALAHRDIKSNNILVKKDGSCCICDLGNAICRNNAKTLDLLRLGTARYLSPQYLNYDDVSVLSFQVHQSSDIYAFGLVIWEIMRRCKTINGVTEPYEVPYYDKLPRCPNVHDVRDVVIVQKLRPVISDRFTDDETMLKLIKIVKECWAEMPAGRPTALRIKKTLKALRNDYL